MFKIKSNKEVYYFLVQSERNNCQRIIYLFIFNIYFGNLKIILDFYFFQRKSTLLVIKIYKNTHNKDFKLVKFQSFYIKKNQSTMQIFLTNSQYHFHTQ